MTETTEPPKRRAASDGDRSRVRASGADKQRRAEPPPADDDARVAKVMARAGLCSRRDAESWIAAGRVAVNGRTIDSPALNVGPRDRITVDGAALPEREPTRLFLFHKPRGLVTTARDPEGRPTIFENLPEGLPRVISVGRLDINTEGLMLLTNDGGLARVLELPSTGWLRRYRVRANGTIDQAQLDALKDGITLDGVDYVGIDAVLDRQQGANVWLTMGLREGKNREIKRVLESLGLAVTRLIRVSFGPFQLGELVAGAAESVPTRILRDQLGPDLAAKARVSLAETVTKPTAAVRQEVRPRAHVSALRTARDEAAEGPRRRIERAATADRRGRPVTIERVVPAGTRPRTAAGAGRAARRSEEDKQPGANPGRVRRDQPASAERPRRDTSVRFREQTRNDRHDESAEQPPAARSRPLGAPSRGRIDGDRTFGSAARSPGESRFGKRPQRDTAPTVEGRARDDHGSATSERPRVVKPRRFGGASSDARPTSGDRARRGFSGKPNGRPGGFGSERPATGRNRSDTLAERGGDRPTRSTPRSADAKGGSRPIGTDRPSRSGKPSGSRPSNGRPSSGRPSGSKPSGNSPSGSRPPRGRP